MQSRASDVDGRGEPRGAEPHGRAYARRIDCGARESPRSAPHPQERGGSLRDGPERLHGRRSPRRD